VIHNSTDENKRIKIKTINLIILDGNWQSIGHLAVITEQSEQNQYLDVASKDGHFLVLYCLLVKRIHFYTHGALQSVSSLMEIMKNIKPR